MSGLSINQKKLIRGLSRRKIRQDSGLFLVEGEKMVREVLKGASADDIRCTPRLLAATREWLDQHGGNLDPGVESCSITAEELKQVSSLRKPNRVLLVSEQPSYDLDLPGLASQLCLAIETVQDPGNLGTILRTADWFGIRNIICSHDSVDLFNPKVIQATMGSFLRVKVHYAKHENLLSDLKEIPGYEIFATSGSGENIYEASLPATGMILLGNESKGLSRELISMADRVVQIPFHDPRLHPESLNISTAAGIICAEFRRQGA